MKYDFDMPEANVRPHTDIEKDLQEKKDGQFTFTIRINAGNVVDYNVVEYVNARQKYLRLKSVTIEEHTISYPVRGRSEGSAVRSSNI